MLLTNPKPGGHHPNTPTSLDLDACTPREDSRQPHNYVHVHIMQVPASLGPEWFIHVDLWTQFIGLQTLLHFHYVTVELLLAKSAS